MLLKGKVAVVTGGSQGIGKGIAKAFSAQGAEVVICARNGDKLKAAAEEIERVAGSKATAVVCDVSRKSDIEAVLEKVMGLYGRLDILVNNAAVQVFHPFFEIPEDIWDMHYEINVKGVFLFSQAAARIMVQQGGGKIINISSDSGVAPIPDNAAAYCSSKSAVIGLTRNISKEPGRYGVYCNAICPGAIDDTECLNITPG